MRPGLYALVLSLVMAGAGVGAAAPGPTGDDADLARLRERTLIVPVEGVRAADLVDTFLQGRDKDSRAHEALDNAAPHGRPVLAVEDGRIVKLFVSRQGGLTNYQFDPAGCSLTATRTWSAMRSA